jgi:asparagine synthase (glutamine-hydrolysing)
MTEREIGCLLSGGLDSSLICALVNKYYEGPKLNTFSIGLPGSIDLEYAQTVADHLDTKHHQIEVSEDEFLDAIETVIYNIESYDTTTVRASVGNYLVSKYISEHSDCKVIFNGDGADEACCGYVYLKNAPTSKDLQKESEKLVEEIHYFDVLRSDRSISSNGLEARTPFLDKAFVKYYLSIPPELKSFDGINRLEKYLLRQAFEGQGILPDEVLWRRKCAFSDGVSAKKKSWHHIIQAYVDKKISDNEFQQKCKTISHCTPALKESYYYRKVFDSYFGENEKLIPHFWMPKWTDVIDPSARELQDYRE